MIGSSRDLKFLYISSVDISIGNGPGVNEREFIIGMHALLGNSIKFVIPKPSETLHDEKFPFSSCIFAPTFKRGQKLRYLPHVVSQLLLARKLLKKEDFALIIYRLAGLPLVPFALARMFRDVPYAIKTFGPSLITALKSKRGILPSLLSKPNRYLVTSVVQGALVADCVSELHIMRSKELFPNICPLEMVDNSVNTMRFFPIEKDVARRRLGLERFNKIVGYVGNVPWARGARQLIEATPKLVARYPNLGVVVLGDGDGLGTLRELASNLGVSNHVVFAGNVPYDTVPDWVNSLDVGVSFLSPAQSGASEQKVRQYLACGVPVVVSNGSSRFVEASGIGSVVDYDDIDKIYASIKKFLDLDVESQVSIARKARTYAIRNLSLDHSCRRRLDLWFEYLLKAREPLSTIIPNGLD